MDDIREYDTVRHGGCKTSAEDDIETSFDDVDLSSDAGSNTVNIENATYKNSIGKAQFISYWEDPDFNPKEQAFYYIRVIEIPTPRWTTYDSEVFGNKLPTFIPASHQERAYTSPIWYSPE